jgi:hypothetical protein
MALLVFAAAQISSTAHPVLNCKHQCCIISHPDALHAQQGIRNHIMCIFSTCWLALRTLHLMVGRPSR